MKITKRQLRKLIAEAMFDPRAARAAARERVKQSIPPEKMAKLDNYLDDDDEESAAHGHSMLDALGDYDSPTGDSFQDIKDFDQQMDASMTEYRKMQMVEEFENQYMPNEGTEIMTALYKVADTPHVHLYVVSLGDDYETFKAPGSEVVRNPEAFGLMAIGTDDSAFSDAVGKHLGVNFDGDDMDAILMLLEKMAGDNNIGHIPEGYQYSPEAAFLAWITQNNSYLHIYADP